MQLIAQIIRIARLCMDAMHRIIEVADTLLGRHTTSGLWCCARLDVHCITTLPVLVASRHPRESGHPGDEGHGDWILLSQA